MKRPMIFSGPTDTDDVAAGHDAAWWCWDHYGCWSTIDADGRVTETGELPPGEYAPREATP